MKYISFCRKEKTWYWSFMRLISRLFSFDPSAASSYSVPTLVAALEPVGSITRYDVFAVGNGRPSTSIAERAIVVSFKLICRAKDVPLGGSFTAVAATVTVPMLDDDPASKYRYSKACRVVKQQEELDG